MKITKKQYLEAAELVFKDGLCYMGQGQKGGPRCLIGHLMTVTDTPDKLPNSYTTPWAVIEKAGGFAINELWYFNDGIHSARATPDEVSNFLCFMAAACKDL